MTEQIEFLIKVSTKGQIIIPKELCKKLGVKGGEMILVISRDGDILLRKAKEKSIRDITKEVDRAFRAESTDLDRIVTDAIDRARRSK